MQLSFESASGSLDLAAILLSGVGIEAMKANGLGLPAIAGNWQEGAGNGATRRGSRILARDIDLSLHIKGSTHADLKSRLNEFSKFLGYEDLKLQVVDEEAATWQIPVAWTGGGNYTQEDIDADHGLDLSISLRAGDPFFISTTPLTVTYTTFGAKTWTDTVSDSETFPQWELTGPLTDIQLIGTDSELLQWTGTLADGAKLYIDTQAGTVKDGLGANQYANLGTAPRFWRMPADGGSFTITVTGSGANTAVKLTTSPRTLAVI